MHQPTKVFPSVPVSFTGQSLVSHAGARILTSFIDALGFRDLCEDRLGQFVPAMASHRPGRLLGSLAVMLAAGGEHASDLDILRSQPGVFGKVPSNATVSRFFERTVKNPEVFDFGFSTLAKELRTRAWEAAGDRSPAVKATAAVVINPGPRNNRACTLVGILTHIRMVSRTRTPEKYLTE